MGNDYMYKFYRDKEAANKCYLHYQKQIEGLDKKIISSALSICSHPLYEYYVYDQEALVSIKTIFESISSLPYGIIIYRGGQIKYRFRPYVSATYQKKIAKSFNKNINTIIAIKGSKILPIGCLMSDENEPEQEVIIESKRSICIFPKIYIYY